MENLENLGVPEVEHLVKDVTKLYIGIAIGVRHVVVERNEANERNKALLPLVPHQLVVLPHSFFFCIVHTKQERLLATGWSIPTINEM